MTPAARLQAAIELLDAIIAAARDDGAPADRIVRDYFRSRRYAGSKDRRAVGELVYGAIRHFGDRPMSGRAAMVALADKDDALLALFDGADFGPSPVTDNEPRATGGAVPLWLEPLLAQPEGGLDRIALLERAPLDIRANALKTSRDAVRALFPEARVLEASPMALRLPAGTPVEQHSAYADGLFEVQDLGSQIIADACDARGGMTVLDLCAGAGGKTLALASAMGGAGKLIAADTSRKRLDQLPGRAQRAGASGIDVRLLDPNRENATLFDLAAKCDVVLVDAPCSGSGTWRRNPETRWRLTSERLQRTLAQQARLLDLAADYVAPGGRLVYAVCSLIEQEGRDQVSSFLARQGSFGSLVQKGAPGRIHGDGRLLTPCHDGCDGFYVATLVKSG